MFNVLNQVYVYCVKIELDMQYHIQKFRNYQSKI